MNVNPTCLKLVDRIVIRRGVVVAFILIAIASHIAQAEDSQRKLNGTQGLAKKQPTSGRFVKTDHGFMVPYKATIPGTKVTFEMVPIPGGTFTMGSPATEKHRKKGEGPQFEVIVEPFWIGKYEVTWGEYQEYMGLYRVFRDIAAMREILASIKENDPRKKKKNRQRLDLLKLLEKHPKLKVRLAKPAEKIDAITAPSEIYDPATTYESGEDPRQPAVTMTQFSAKQYTKWLSYLTGRTKTPPFHRAPGGSRLPRPTASGFDWCARWSDRVRKKRPASGTRISNRSGTMSVMTYTKVAAHKARSTHNSQKQPSPLKRSRKCSENRL